MPSIGCRTCKKMAAVAKESLFVAPATDENKNLVVHTRYIVVIAILALILIF